MNNDTNEGKWKQIKGEFKDKFGEITNNKSMESEGEIEKWMGKMQEKFGKTKDEIAKKIKNW